VYTCHIVNMLPLFMIGGKTPLEVWPEKVAQDYDSLRVFGCLAYYHVKEDKLGPRERSVRRIQERRKRLQNLGSKGQEVYLE